MVGAATKWYYDHVLSLYNGKKEELTKCISHFGDETSPQFKPLDESQFTRYELAFRKHGKDGIRVDKKQCIQTEGCDTIWRLNGNKQGAASKKAKKRASPSKSDTLAKGKPRGLKSMYPKSPPARKRSRPNYYEGDDDAASGDQYEEESDEEEPRARTSSRKARANRNKASDNNQYESPGSMENDQKIISLCDSSDKEEEMEEETPTFNQTTCSSVKEEEIGVSAGTSKDVEVDEVKEENAKLKKELDTLHHALSAKDRSLERLRMENESLKKQLDHLRMECGTKE